MKNFLDVCKNWGVDADKVKADFEWLKADPSYTAKNWEEALKVISLFGEKLDEKKLQALKKNFEKFGVRAIDKYRTRALGCKEYGGDIIRLKGVRTRNGCDSLYPLYEVESGMLWYVGNYHVTINADEFKF